MHVRDYSVCLKATLAPGLVIALSLSGSPADAPSLLKGPLAGYAPSVAPMTASALARSDTAGTPRGMNGWRHGGTSKEGAWQVRADRGDAAISTCGQECLERLRQRLLDHHREAAPIWVF